MLGGSGETIEATEPTYGWELNMDKKTPKRRANGDLAELLQQKIPRIKRPSTSPISPASRTGERVFVSPTAQSKAVGTAVKRKETSAYAKNGAARTFTSPGFELYVETKIVKLQENNATWSQKECKNFIESKWENLPEEHQVQLPWNNLHPSTDIAVWIPPVSYTCRERISNVPDIFVSVYIPGEVWTGCSKETERKKICRKQTEERRAVQPTRSGLCCSVEQRVSVVLHLLTILRATRLAIEAKPSVVKTLVTGRSCHRCTPLSWFILGCWNKLAVRLTTYCPMHGMAMYVCATGHARTADQANIPQMPVGPLRHRKPVRVCPISQHRHCWCFAAYYHTAINVYSPQ